MAITSSDLENDFLLNLERKTGNDINHWIKVLHRTGYSSRAALLGYMTGEQKWDYLQSQLLIGIFLNNGKRVYDGQTTARISKSLRK